MSAFVKITCINNIGVDSAKFGNEAHFISLILCLSLLPEMSQMVRISIAETL